MDLGLLTLGDHRADPASGAMTSQAQRHQHILEYLDYAEPAGFDAAFVGEHHFSDFITASPAVFLAWLAGRTTNITVGSGVSLLPHHDPVKLAEDFATLDVVSGGRAEMWVKVAVSRQESAIAAAELGLGITITMLSFEREHLGPVVEAYRSAFADGGHDARSSSRRGRAAFTYHRLRQPRVFGCERQPTGSRRANRCLGGSGGHRPLHLPGRLRRPALVEGDALARPIL